jgi:major membrane immunogen (membrane-anchored lipoprotein)
LLMKKRMYFIVLTLICIMLFSSCSYSTIMSKETQTATSWDMSYAKFTGSKSHTITLKEGQKVEFTIDIVSDAGQLDFSIIDEGSTSHYTGTDIPTSNFTVSADQSGKYEMTFKAKEHKGSFSVSWKITD